jgi:hypothetical protein
LGNAGDPVECPLNGGLCYGLENGESYLTNYSGLEYVYAGDSSTGASGIFYVDALAIDISPGYYTLDGGEQVTFTAGASNTGMYLPFYQWTLVGGPGSGVVSGSSDQDYTYTAPPQVASGNTTATVKGCITNLTSSPVCQTVTIDLLLETISVDTPSPNVLLANGSTASLQANITNGAENATAFWTSSLGVSIPTGLSTTYTAPVATSALFSKSNTATDNIFATILGSSPAVVSQTTSLTLVEPVTITNVSPASWTAGTANIPVTINGTGFSASSTVTISSPTWPLMTYSCTPTSNPTSIPCSVTIPANLSNMTASQGATITVTTTTSGLTSTAASNPISITPIAYSYSMSLLTSTSSLWYGSTSTITPVITCKVASTGAACASNVQNPQLANFTIINGAGLGSLSATTNAASTVLTDTALIAAPSQNVTVQGCASVWLTACATTNFTIPATSIMLNPPTMASPLTGGKTQLFTASIQNEGTATANALTWTLTPSTGTLTSATTTITVQGSPVSGTSGPNTYTAPATITSPGTVTLTACMAANTGICATPVVITLQPAPTFTVTAAQIDRPLSLPPNTLSMGHTIAYAVGVTSLYGFSGTVSFQPVGGLPAGITATFSASAVNVTSSTSGSAELILAAGYGAGASPPPPLAVNVTGTGTSSGSASSVTNSTGFTLTPRAMQYAGSCGVSKGIAPLNYPFVPWVTYPSFP